MADGADTLADRWLRRIKNNPAVAGLFVVAALLAVAQPAWKTVAEIVRPTANPAEIASLTADRDTILVPVRNALLENKAVFDRLTSDLYREPGWGVQESYYERVRRDGADRHELMRGMIDSLVQNNRKILATLDPYMGRARAAAFRQQEPLFRTHARLYDARWAGMREAAVSGERQPIAEPPFPRTFPSSLDAEIRAVDDMIRKATG